MLVALLRTTTAVVAGGFLFLAALWVWYRWTRREIIRQAEKLPTVFPRMPILGHIYCTIGGMEKFTDTVLKVVTTAIEKGYDEVCFWAGPVPLIITLNSNDIKHILNSSSSLHKGNEMENYLKEFVDEGLLTARVEQWKTTRRHMNTLFHPRNLQHMVPMFNENSKEFVSYLSDHVDQGPINVMPPLMDISLKTICHLIFGPEVQIDTKSEEFRSVMKVVEWMPEVFIARIVKMWLRIDVVFKFLYRKELHDMYVAWQKFTELPLKRAKANYLYRSKVRDELKENGTDGDNQDKDLATAVSVYSWMQENFPNVTEKSLREEMLTLYLTGTDTIGNATSYCLLALGQYQDIQDTLYKEIESVVGLQGDIMEEDLRKMPYLEKVLKETLRFFLIIPFISRRCTENLKIGPCEVPANTTIFMCIAGLHLDPKTYPEPHRFNPERFSPENAANLDRYRYIPFSAGPRNCIGKTYSYLLMKILLIHILRRYRVTTTMDIHNLKRKYVTTLNNCEGYNVSFHAR